jgi:carbon monoxide dehydrogenase subunit G
MQGSRTLAASVAQAWEALNDPTMLQACIPGCEKFELSGPDTYTVTTAIKIGPVAARFSGRVRLSDIVPLQSYTLGFEAQGGVAGFGKGEAAVRLQATEAGCDLSYRVHSTVGGKLAQLGQRLIEGASRSLAEDFFRRFDEALKRRYAGATDAAPATAPAAAAPGRRPAWTWAALAAAVAALLYLATKG